MAKILLVEDERNIASFIERGLHEFGHTVSVTHDGTTAWELLQHEAFDLLVLDIIMPGINGLTYAGNTGRRKDIRHLSSCSPHSALPKI